MTKECRDVGFRPVRDGNVPVFWIFEVWIIEAHWNCRSVEWKIGMLAVARLSVIQLLDRMLKVEDM